MPRNPWAAALLAMLPAAAVPTHSAPQVGPQHFGIAVPGGFAAYLLRGSLDGVAVSVPGADWSVMSKPVIAIRSAGEVSLAEGWNDLELEPSIGCSGLYVSSSGSGGRHEIFCFERVEVPLPGAVEVSKVLLSFNLTGEGREISVGVRSQPISDFQVIAAEENGTAEVEVGERTYRGRWIAALRGWLFSSSRKLMLLSLGGTLRNYTVLLQTVSNSPIELDLSDRVSGVVAVMLEPAPNKTVVRIARGGPIPAGRDLSLSGDMPGIFLWLLGGEDFPTEAEILSLELERDLSELVVKVPDNVTAGDYEVRAGGADLDLSVVPRPGDGGMRVQIPTRLSAGSRFTMKMLPPPNPNGSEIILLSEILPYAIVMNLSRLPPYAFDVSIDIPHSSVDLSSEVMLSVLSGGELAVQERRPVSLLGSVRVSVGGPEIYSLIGEPIELEILNMGTRPLTVVNVTPVLDGEPGETLDVNLTIGPMTSSDLELNVDVSPGEHELSVLLGVQDPPWSGLLGHGPERLIAAEAAAEVYLVGGERLRIGEPVNLTLEIRPNVPMSELSVSLNVTGAEFNLSGRNLSWKDLSPGRSVSIPIILLSEDPGSAEIAVEGRFLMHGREGVFTRKLTVEFGGITGRAVASVNSSVVSPGSPISLKISVLGPPGSVTVIVPEGFTSPNASDGVIELPSPGTFEIPLRAEASPGTYLLPLMVRIGNSSIPVDPAEIVISESTSGEVKHLLARLLDLKRRYNSLRELGRGEIYVVVGGKNMTAAAALSLASNLIDSGRYSEASEVLDSIEDGLGGGVWGGLELDEPDLLLALTVIGSALMILLSSVRRVSDWDGSRS